MSKKDSNEKEGNGRLKILQAASEIFAQKGFDGSRVDEIAKSAGVNKALIYYYFESKEKILEELFKNYNEEMIQKKHSYMNQIDFLDLNKLEEYTEKNISFVKEGGENIFKIALVEAMKDNKQDNSLFQMMDMFIEDLIPLWKEKGIEINKNKIDQLLIPAFFFGLAPLMFYITLGDRWAEYYKIDKDELHKKFVASLNKAYAKDLIEPLLENKK